MEGGPSHIDLFDPKPELTRLHGQPLPASFGKVLTPMGTGGNTLLASKRTFSQARPKSASTSPTGCRTWPSCADDLAVLRVLLGRRAEPRRLASAR